MKNGIVVIFFLMFFSYQDVFGDESSDYFQKNPFMAHHMQRGVPACLTRDYLRQFLNASITKDSQAMNYLLSHGCILFRPDIHITVLDVGNDAGPLTLVKVRGYISGGQITAVMWTFRLGLAK